jgi:hypothetical protein
MKPRQIGRSLGYHALAAGVLAAAAIAGIVGSFIGANLIDPRPFIGSDNHPFDPSEHPSTLGYIGEVVFAAVPVVLISLAMVPLLRRAGAPKPRFAALAFSLIPIAAFTLGQIDQEIHDTRFPQGCCAGPGLNHQWWTVWAVAAILLTVVSVLTSARAGSATSRGQGQEEAAATGQE